MSLGGWMETNSSLNYEDLTTVGMHHYGHQDIFDTNHSSAFTDNPLNLGYNTTIFDEVISTTPIPMPIWKVIADTILKYLLGTNVVFVMFGMGCAIDWKDIVNNLWPPVGILIGMFGQFILLPGLAFTFSMLFNLRPYEALGCLIVSCCPGGSFSNFATYWVEGELALSIVMTTCSSLIALVGMPFNLWLYSSFITGEDASVVIPVWNIMRGLTFVCTPVLLGMIVRHFTVRIADRVTKIAGIVSYIGFVLVVGSYIIIHYSVFVTATPLIYAGGIILPITGFFGAYLVAYIFKRSHKICRTIGVETGSQNMPIAMTIILFSFDDPVATAEMLLFPTIYGLFMFGEIFMMISIYQVAKKIMKRGKEENEEKSMAYKATILESGTVEEKSKIKSY